MFITETRADEQCEISLFAINFIILSASSVTHNSPMKKDSYGMKKKIMQALQNCVTILVVNNARAWNEWWYQDILDLELFLLTVLYRRIV